MNARRWISGVLASGVLVLLASATAWACISGPAVHFSTINAKPGDTVTVTGSGFSQKGPVAVHWNALTAPALTTMHVPAVDGAVMGTFNVPADAQTGTYVVIFTQTTTDGKLSLAPIRAVITVASNGATAPAAIASSGAARADGLVTSNSAVGTGSLVLVALGVAGVGIFLAGTGLFVANRRRSTPEAVRSGQ